MSAIDPAAATEARKGRRAFAASPVSAFVRAMRDAMQQYRQMRQEGVTRDDAVRGLELVLRDAWPKRASKFAPLCGQCEGTGWRELYCDARMRCGRERCARNPEIEHRYVVACDCVSGDRMRARVRTAEDAVAAASRTQKKRGGFGRM